MVCFALQKVEFTLSLYQTLTHAKAFFDPKVVLSSLRLYLDY